MRILFVTTKPPWPPHDGGRLAVLLTLQGLASLGHQITLVAPVERSLDQLQDSIRKNLSPWCETVLVRTTRGSWLKSLVLAALRNTAVTIERHHSLAMEKTLSAVIEKSCPDVVHAEQLQAFKNCAPAHRLQIPVVLRMQNVESDLWEQFSRISAVASLLKLEAYRVRREERRAMATAAWTVALTARDKERLKSISIATRQSGEQLSAIPVPFPSCWPSAPRLAGNPCLVISGSRGWLPNSDGLRWFLTQVWPALLKTMPRAQLHVFGGDEGPDGQGIQWHPAPENSIDSYPSNAIVVLPLRIASGVRMRILEAWARGLPVIATTAAAAGLEPGFEQSLSIVDDPDDFTSAIVKVATDPTHRARLVQMGYRCLERSYYPRTISERLVNTYRLAMTR
jgi:polysaccharide biosynthesis protein PslH